MEVYTNLRLFFRRVAASSNKATATLFKLFIKFVRDYIAEQRGN